MKAKKVNGYEIQDRKPKAGDVMICINKKSVNYGILEEATEFQVKNSVIDTKNWKVVIDKEERKEQIVDAVIDKLKEDFASGDYTVLDDLLKMIPNNNLVQALDESQWKHFPEVKIKNTRPNV